MIKEITKFLGGLRRKRDTSPTGEKLPPTPKGIPEEKGSAGLNMFGGLERKNEDHPVEVSGLSGATKFFRQMTKDPTIGGSLQMYTSICQMAQWHAESATDDKKPGWSDEEADKSKIFLEECIKDMQGSMNDIVSQVLDMLVHGFHITVPQFKFRQGPDQEDPRRRSRYNDNKIGWNYWKSIDPYSVYRWDTPRGEGYSLLKGIQQQTISGFSGYIERDRMLLFRTTAKNDSPSGESVLVSAVEPWEEKKRSANIELTGLERNLEGIPVFDVPAAYLSEHATEEQKAIVQYIKKAGTSLKYNNQTYMLRPSDRDDNGHRLIDLELLSTSGTTRPEAARAIVEAKERLIAEAVLSQFLKLGSSSGSYALSSDMTDLFVLVLKTYVDHIKEVINSEAIPYLFKLNKMDMRYLPRMEYSGLEKDNVSEWMNSLSQVANANLIVPSKEIQDEILERLDLPKEEAGKKWDEIEKIRDDLAEKFSQAEEGAQAVKGAGSGKNNDANGSVSPKEGSPVQSIIKKLTK
jgi:transcriptional regulator with XRE-family HTH domain